MLSNEQPYWKPDEMRWFEFAGKYFMGTGEAQECLGFTNETRKPDVCCMIQFYNSNSSSLTRNEVLESGKNFPTQESKWVDSDRFTPTTFVQTSV